MADFFTRERQRADRGCLIDILLVILGCIFPVLFIGIIPYLVYSGFKDAKYYGGMLDMQKKADRKLESELRKMTPEQIEAKRIEMLMILQSPYSTQAEKDAAAYTIHYIEKRFYQY